MPLGTSQQTITTGTVFIPEVWSPETLRATESALVMAKLVKRYDSEVTQKGDTIHIPNITNFTASSKSANTEVTLQAPTETQTNISINQHYESSFLVEDLLRIQSNYDLMSEYTSKAGYSIAQRVDTDLLGLYSSLTTTDVGSYGTDIGDNAILQSLETLNLNDVPMEDRAMVVDPTQLTAIMRLDRFTKSDYLGEWDQPTPVKTGPKSRYLWGDIYGVPVYWTNQVATTAGTPTQYHNMVFHKEAFALALQQAPRTQSAYILEYLGNLVVVDIVYGTAVLRATFGVELRS